MSISTQIGLRVSRIEFDRIRLVDNFWFEVPVSFFIIEVRREVYRIKKWKKDTKYDETRKNRKWYMRPGKMIFWKIWELPFPTEGPFTKEIKRDSDTHDDIGRYDPRKANLTPSSKEKYDKIDHKSDDEARAYFFRCAELFRSWIADENPISKDEKKEVGENKKKSIKHTSCA